MEISIIVATDLKGAIGFENKLLWHLPADMKFFKEKTMGHCMVMGRKTYESIGKPLPGRTTIIVTRDKNYKAEGCEIVHSIEAAIEKAEAKNDTEVMIIGGAEIYRQSEPFATQIYLTEVEGDFIADTYFKIDFTKWEKVTTISFTPDEKNKFHYHFHTLKKAL